MLHDKLKELDTYPFHMPGHKRNSKFGIIGSEIDITEINGYDDLHNPKGLIKETENKLSELYGSKESIMLVNGSTVGILSAVFAMTNDGDTVIVAANCHKSVYNACALRKLKVVIAQPDFDEINGIFTKISQKEINNLLGAYPDAKLVIITSPTYEGYISNISIKIPLLIDAAHGAHLPFCDFGEYPKADIVISSLHKTLPALTQTAVANIYNDEFTSEMRRFIDIFETSSPSYVLMNSVSVCAEYLETQKNDFKIFEKSLRNFYSSTKLEKLSFIKAEDLSKINISTANCDISGRELADILRLKYSFECESAQLRHVILMATVGDDTEIFKKLSHALTEIDQKVNSKESQPLPRPEISGKSYNFEIYNENTDKTELKKSYGKISAEFIYAFPPGILVILPGDIISQDNIEMINKLINSGINVISTSKLLPDFILTKRA